MDTGWELLTDICLVGTLLLFATFIRTRIRLLQKIHGSPGRNDQTESSSLLYRYYSLPWYLYSVTVHTPKVCGQRF